MVIGTREAVYDTNNFGLEARNRIFLATFVSPLSRTWTSSSLRASVSLSTGTGDPKAPPVSDLLVPSLPLAWGQTLRLVSNQ